VCGRTSEKKEAVLPYLTNYNNHLQHMANWIKKKYFFLKTFHGKSYTDRK
jgi:hypothetical protein